MARIDPTAHAHPTSGQASGKHADGLLTSIGKAIFAPMEGAHAGVTLPHTHHDVPSPQPLARRDEAHHPHMLSSLGKAMLAPFEGSHGGLSGVARHRHAASPSKPGETPAPADEPDPRVVGGDDDNPLESIGKAIIAPVEGADEGAGKPGSLRPAKKPGQDA